MTENDPRPMVVTVADGRTVARLRGDVDRANAASVGAELTEARGDGTLVIDLSETNYLDSAGIATIEEVGRAGPTRLVVPGAAIVRRALEVTGILELLPTYESVGDALG